MFTPAEEHIETGQIFFHVLTTSPGSLSRIDVPANGAGLIRFARSIMRSSCHGVKCGWAIRTEDIGEPRGRARHVQGCLASLMCCVGGVAKGGAQNRTEEWVVARTTSSMSRTARVCCSCCTCCCCCCSCHCHDTCLLFFRYHDRFDLTAAPSPEDPPVYWATKNECWTWRREILRPRRQTVARERQSWGVLVC